MTGDLFSPGIETDAICIPTNTFVNRSGAAIMGAGLALEAKARWPGIERRLGLVLQEDPRPRAILLDADPKYAVIAFATKRHWREDSTLDILCASAKSLVALAGTAPLRNGPGAIVLPRVGCGFGRLDWRDVAPVLADILKGPRFVVVAPKASHY